MLSCLTSPILVRLATVVFVATFVLSLSAVPVPPLDVPNLTDSAELIVVGRVAHVWETSRSDMEVRGTIMPVQAIRADMQVDRVLKGTLNILPLTIEFLMPISPGGSMGYHGILQSTYRVVFLKHGDHGYEFASPYYPSLVAVPGVSMHGETPLDAIVTELSAVLKASLSSPDEKREAVLALGTIRTSSASEALRAANTSQDVSVRFVAVQGLLLRNDFTGLRMAVDELLQPRSGIPHMSHNLAYAISQSRPDERSIPEVSRLLHSASVETRRAAASALRNTGSRSAIDGLTTALSDNDFEVRYFGVIGLAEITGQSEWRPLEDEFKSNEQRYLSHWLQWATANTTNR